MKKYKYIILIILFCFVTTACKDTASMAVEKYLAKYNNLDTEVLTDMQKIIEKENLSDESKKIYKSIFEKQYTDMTYKIVEEEYNGNDATIDVQITVYDLYKAQNDANSYLINHPEEIATIEDSRNVRYKDQVMSFNQFGCELTGWKAIQIYAFMKKVGGDKTLSKLREEKMKELGMLS